MRRWNTILIAAFVLANLIVSSGVCQDYEADTSAREKSLPLQPTSDWNSQFSFTYLPDADLNGTSASAGISDFRMRLVRNQKITNNLTLTAGGGYGLKHIDASSTANLPHDLHAVFLEAAAHYRINRKSFASIRLYPGFYSDFRDIGSDDVRLPLLALGGYSFDNGITIVGGFVYRFGYHAAAFIPALGITYQVNDRWRLDLIAPRPAVTYSASPKLKLFVCGDFSSDEYELHDRSLGAKVIRYRDLKVMGGIEYLPSNDVKLSAALGYAFDRRFDFYDASRSGMGLDDVIFLRLSLDLGW